MSEVKAFLQFVSLSRFVTMTLCACQKKMNGLFCSKSFDEVLLFLIQ